MVGLVSFFLTLPPGTNHVSLAGGVFLIPVRISLWSFMSTKSNVKSGALDTTILNISSERKDTWRLIRISII